MRVGDELYCVGSLQNGTPKKDLRLPFSLVRFFWASKRNEQDQLEEQKNREKVYNVIPRMRNQKEPFASSTKPNEQSNLGKQKKLINLPNQRMEYQNEQFIK